jgi:hypothetical protein
MDYIGSGLILACITCLLLALQWGGNDYAWSSSFQFCQKEVANSRLAYHPPLRHRWCPCSRLWVLGMVHRHQSLGSFINLEE